MEASNSNEFKLLEAVKEYHLENQKGQSNYSKLYFDMPRYGLKKGDIYQALQKGAYGQRFSELGQNVKEWVKQAVRHSNGSLWNNGTFVLRDVRGRPGVVSNHSRGLAVDLSYRWQAQKNVGRKDGRKISLAFMLSV